MKIMNYGLEKQQTKRDKITYFLQNRARRKSKSFLKLQKNKRKRKIKTLELKIITIIKYEIIKNETHVRGSKPPLTRGPPAL